MVSLNTSYLVIKVNVLGHFNIIAANLNKKTVSDNMCKDKLRKSKVNPLEYYYSYIPRTKLLFFYCLASANVKLGYYHSIFAGVSAEDITISARYCSFIMSL